MAHPAPADTRMTCERYFRLAEEGLLADDDRVELLEGVIVAMPPQGPPHAGVIRRNRFPDPATRQYRETRIARRGEQIALDAMSDLALTVDDLLGPE
jgi:hypothetical protein